MSILALAFVLTACFSRNIFLSLIALVFFGLIASNLQAVKYNKYIIRISVLTLFAGVFVFSGSDILEKRNIWNEFTEGIQNASSLLISLTIVAFAFFSSYEDKEATTKLKSPHQQPSVNAIQNFFQKKFYLIICASVIIIGLFLRVWKLGESEFLRDEYGVLWNAKMEFLGGEYSYSRAKILTILYTVLYKVFGFHTGSFFNTLPIILFSIANTVLIYLISKKIFSPRAAIITIILYYLSPYALSMSLYIREYELYLTLSLFIIYAILEYSAKTVCMMLLGYCAYLLYDQYTGGTFIVSLPFVASMCMAKYHTKLLKIVRTHPRKFLSLIVFFALFLIIFHKHWFWLIDKIEFRKDYIEFIVSRSLNIGKLQLLLVTGSIFIFFFKYSQKKISHLQLFLFFAVCSYFIYYYCFIGIHFAPRYSYYFFAYALIFIGGMYGVGYPRKIVTSSMVIFTILLLHSSFLEVSAEQKNSYNRYVGTNTYKSRNFIDFIKTNNLQEEINTKSIITANGGMLGFYIYEGSNFSVKNEKFGYIGPDNFYSIDSSQNDQTDITSYQNVIREHAEGYIIVDWRSRELFSLPQQDFYVGDKKVKMILNGSYFLYAW